MADILRPRAMPDSAVVGLFSPSEPLDEVRTARLNGNIDALSAELTFRIAESAFAADAYMAGTPEQRLSDLRQLLGDASIHAILSTWGGKSSVQLINGFPYREAVDRSIPILGFSDVAAILNAVTLRTGLITFYGPNVAGKLDESRHANLAELRSTSSWPPDVLGSDAQSLSVGIRPGEGAGVLLGGNLSTFAAVYPVFLTQGLDIPNDIIFFWESGSGRPHEIDQTLTVLESLGLFSRVRGMVVGTVGSGEGSTVRPGGHLALAVARPVAGYDFPIWSCPTFGHSKLENPIIPIGAPARLDVSHEGFASLSLLSDPVIR